MINANELRLGNWVKYAIDAVPAEVEGISEDILVAGIWRMTDQIEPIPLTPEILLQCGFTNNWVRLEDRPDKPNNDVVLIVHVELEAACIYNLTNPRVDQQLPIKIKYLHQLQNLFYSMTSEELRFCGNSTKVEPPI